MSLAYFQSHGGHNVSARLHVHMLNALEALYIRYIVGSHLNCQLYVPYLFVCRKPRVPKLADDPVHVLVVHYYCYHFLPVLAKESPRFTCEFHGSPGGGLSPHIAPNFLLL